LAKGVVRIGTDTRERGKRCGLLGLLYTRTASDPATVKPLPERYTAGDISEKVVRDINHWYGINAVVCDIARFGDLQHTTHKQGAVISWTLK
jgi:hypothetical protein